ncbi:MAG: sigma-70 family RNA polymerase sigma factor [Prolixibacteraceae bacterium]|nr:sigma-70 family RNA polymerase sigma factor [Prolixibacteraceae bacterium]
MTAYTNEELLKGILKNNHVVLKYIYKSYFHKVNAFVCANNGTENDANDVFQESIIIIYRKLKKRKLVLDDKSFETLIHSICRFLWLRELELKRGAMVTVSDMSNYSESIFDEELEEIVLMNERYRLYQEHFQKLGKDCQKILRLFLQQVALKEIADRLGLVSESYAKKRKHQCKEYLIRSIKQDTEFKKIIENDL